jgi:hypothetical protein
MTQLRSRHRQAPRLKTPDPVGFAYTAFVTDACTSAIVGWAVATHDRTGPFSAVAWS